MKKLEEKKEKDYKYKFSVVMPIYNTETYISEAIESLINQTIGFENIQLILVNDGSTDNSEEICLQYKKKYDNIIYIKQDNSGVSAARNTGLKYVKGKYINFLDSDDKWSFDVFEKAIKMFEENENIDVIAVRMKFFDALNNFPTNDYKFYKNRVVDIFEEYECTQLSVTSAFIRSSAMKEKRFDKELEIGEDAKLLFEVVLEKEKYGIIADSIHWYRRRFEKNSAVQISTQKLSWYYKTMKLYFRYIFDLSIKKYGKVIPFAQYYFIFDFQWRVMQVVPKWIPEDERKKYIDIVKELLQEIDDRIILSQRCLIKETKVYLLSLKYGRDIRKEFVYDKGKILFQNMEIYDIKDKYLVIVNLIDVVDDNLYLEGKIKDYYPEEDYEIYVKDNSGKTYNLEYYDMPMDDLIAFNGKRFFKGKGFKVKVPLKKVKSMRIMIKYKKHHNKRLTINFGARAGLTYDLEGMYISKGKYCITSKSNKIIIEKKRKKLHFKHECEYLKQLFKLKKIAIINYRICYGIMKKILKRPIWIFSDRKKEANDNGFCMFKYINENAKNINSYFVIDKKSPNYNKVKKIGKVLNINSFKYKLYLLLSSRIISSQADDWIINAFAEEQKYIKDLYNFKFVFLQHGITKDDLSKWLHKQNKNIKLFITATKKEYESIIKGNYGYSKNEVKLTGLSRFDNLDNNTKKKIVFMPTWRKNLSGELDDVSGDRKYNERFKDSDYCKFFNKLINDKRILETLKKYGYSAKFFVHPSIEKQYIDFKGNEYVNVSKELADYQKEFAENALLITDYSSVAFDFAYLKKPVIYTQFDEETFFEGQIYDKGYFNSEKDGFGKVCYDYETTVKEIIKTIQNGCKLEKKYLNRIENCYTYFDKNNCRRVYEEILKL